MTPENQSVLLERTKNSQFYLVNSGEQSRVETIPSPLEARALLNAEQATFQALSRCDRVHLWLLSLNTDKKTVLACFDFLTPKEKQRAQRYLCESERHRFIVTRAILRRLIRGYHNDIPSLFNISEGTFGKPYLESTESETRYHFNISHSGDLALIGFSKSTEIGVDIEEERRLKALTGIAEKVLSEREMTFFLTLTESEKQAIFFRLWTCKESSLKADGFGFHKDPKSLCLFSEAKAQDELSRLLHLEGKTIQWTHHPLGYSLAWALKSNELQEVRWVQI